MKEFWNERFDKEEFVYGTQPNEFFAEQLVNLNKGKILLLGEGEGRNAVFAAKKGWHVDAYDYSTSAKDKAETLAKDNNVRINYNLVDLVEFNPQNGIYDAVGLVYLHFPPEIRKQIHKKAVDSLKKGGKIIAQFFAKEQINNNSGGPKNIDMLYDLDELFEDFQDLELEIFEKVKIELNEGNYHVGSADVINLSALKNH